MSTADQVLLGDLQYALLEPSDGGQAWPSALWTREEVLAICSQRQDRFLFDALCLVKVSALIPIVATQHRFDLPQDWIRTVSVVWIGDDGTVRELPRVDSFEADHAIPTWEATDAAYPLAYADNDTPLLEGQILPAPTGTGNLSLLYIPRGTPLTGNGTLLDLPDEYLHAVKYGALADLLGKDGRGMDPARAAYCEQRVQLATETARLILEGWA